MQKNVNAGNSNGSNKNNDADKIIHASVFLSSTIATEGNLITLTHMIVLFFFFSLIHYRSESHSVYTSLTSFTLTTTR